MGLAAIVQHIGQKRADALQVGCIEHVTAFTPGTHQARPLKKRQMKCQPPGRNLQPTRNLPLGCAIPTRRNPQFTSSIGTEQFKQTPDPPRRHADFSAAHGILPSSIPFQANPEAV